jgi:N-acetylglucosamine malate deacetylase 1
MLRLVELRCREAMKPLSPSPSRRIAVIAAHPDDEVLGCGATIARHAAAGDEVRILILAEGATSRALARDAVAEAGELRSAGEAAARILGAKGIEWAGFADNRMDGMELLDVVKRIERFLGTWQPQVIYTHHAGDVNVDHQVTQRAVMTAARPLPDATFCTVLQFEIASSTEWGGPVTGTPFVPQWFEDVSDFLPLKLAALDAYGAEMRPWPHPRSPEGVAALARWRGATVGVDAAEAFMLGWHIQRKTP